MKKLLNYREVAEKLGIDACNYWKFIKERPSFPKRVNLGPRSVRWVDEEIDAWINNNRSDNHGSSSTKEVDQ